MVAHLVALGEGDSLSRAASPLTDVTLLLTSIDMHTFHMGTEARNVHEPLATTLPQANGLLLLLNLRLLFNWSLDGWTLALARGARRDDRLVAGNVRLIYGGFPHWVYRFTINAGSE
jgi:hypothetical protein